MQVGESIRVSLPTSPYLFCYVNLPWHKTESGSLGL